jgi:hypothetical protein
MQLLWHISMCWLMIKACINSCLSFSVWFAAAEFVTQVASTTLDGHLAFAVTGLACKCRHQGLCFPTSMQIKGCQQHCMTVAPKHRMAAGLPG